MGTFVLDNLISTMFNYKYVGQLLKSIKSGGSKKVIYIEAPTKEPELNYYFIYKINKEKEITGEEYNMAGRIHDDTGRKVPNNEITDKQAVDWYIKTLNDFNKDLRGNQPRKFIRAYKLSAIMKLEKVVIKE